MRKPNLKLSKTAPPSGSAAPLPGKNRDKTGNSCDRARSSSIADSSNTEYSDSNRRKTALSMLLNSKNIWQGGESWKQEEQQRTISTGYQALDRCLHDKGWPRKQLIECLQARQSSPGIDLLMPGLHKLQQQLDQQALAKQPIVLINPPHIPYLAGWQLEESARLWIIKTENLAETIWAAEQALQSNACLATLIWLFQPQLDRADRASTAEITTGSATGSSVRPTASYSKKNLTQFSTRLSTRFSTRLSTQLSTQLATQLRKLQLAANCSHGLTVLFRHQSAAQASSPARLRIVLNIENSPRENTRSLKPGQLNLHILKQPGGWGGQRCVLPWRSRLQQTPIPPQDWPVFHPASNELYHQQEQSKDQQNLERYYS